MACPLGAGAQEAGKVLFIRGAERSGGFFEANNDTGLTEQLADIRNTSTSGGNHGWFEFASLLVDNGFQVEQAIEPLEAGAPTTGQTTGAALSLDGSFTVSDRLGVTPAVSRSLADYDAVIFGSNNAVYGNPQIDALESYVRGGGGVLFISDANFGSGWSDASNSDQQFLDRFGLVVNQDRGTYVLSSAEAGGGAPADYTQGDHPILSGVNAFDGEGVTPFQIGTLTEGVTAEILVQAEGNTSDNTGTDARGDARPVTMNDAALLVAEADLGRIAGHFDRNTFFNQNGAGTFLNRTAGGSIQLDNDIYALNLVTWVANVPEPGTMSTVLLGTLLALKRSAAKRRRV
ncbi:MAG: hypothetical protein AAGG38_13005 [Planctomycetota bacterium]